LLTNAVTLPSLYTVLWVVCAIVDENRL